MLYVRTYIGPVTVTDGRGMQRFTSTAIQFLACAPGWGLRGLYPELVSCQLTHPHGRLGCRRSPAIRNSCRVGIGFRSTWWWGRKRRLSEGLCRCSGPRHCFRNLSSLQDPAFTIRTNSLSSNRITTHPPQYTSHDFHMYTVYLCSPSSNLRIMHRILLALGALTPTTLIRGSFFPSGHIIT